MIILETLPSLQGKRGSVLLVVYRVLAVIVVVMTIGSAGYAGLGYFRDAPAADRYGFLLFSDDAHRPIIYKASPAVLAAGVRNGSRIVAIDDLPLVPGATRFAVGARLSRAHGPLALTLTDDGGRRSRHVLSPATNIAARRDQHHGLSAFAYGVVRMTDRLLAATVLILMSLLLYRRRPRDPEAMLLAVGFMLIAYDWTDSDWLRQLGIGYDPAVEGWMENSLGVIGWWCLLVGLCAFPDGHFATRWSRIARLLPTIYVLANMITNYRMWDFALPEEAVDVPIFVAVAGAVLIRYHNTPAGTERQQIKWAAFGAAIMIAASVLTFAIREPIVVARLGSTTIYFLDVVGNDMKTLAFPVGLLVSLLRYRLYDADSVIVRSAGYAVLTAALIGVFACTEQLAQALGQDYFGNSLGALAGGLGAAVATMMIAPLHRRANDWAERQFRKSLTTLRDALPRALGDMREVAAIPAIADMVLTRCEAALHGTRSALVIDDRPVAVRGIAAETVETWFAQWPAKATVEQSADRHDPVFPLRVPLRADGSGLIGWLLLGPRPDGSLYGRDERETLTLMSDPVARAFAIAIARDRREASLRRELDAQRRLIDRLVERMGVSEEELLRADLPPRHDV